VPRRKFLEGNVEKRVSTGLATWASFTGGEPDAFTNTGCFWWDAECGHSGDECIEMTRNSLVPDHPMHDLN
jgi:hypothetical protein